MKLWLDDVRSAPEGWTHVHTVEQAKALLISHHVSEASLDHDLGACTQCLDGRTPAEAFVELSYIEHDRRNRTCTEAGHHNSGYDLVVWMASEDVWPTHKPSVHSMNPIGAARMRGVIDRYFTAGTQA